MKAKKKKTCACTWCALFSEQVEWENSIESYMMEWRGGGKYKVKKRNVCLFHFYFFFLYVKGQQ